MVDFAGWSMPVLYSSIVDEHVATRHSVGVFDISHMGRLRFDGPRAGELLEGLVTRRVVDMASGQIRYALITDQSGGILDDVLVYRLDDLDGDAFFLLVVNASNLEKVINWIDRIRDPQQVQMTNQTSVTAMIAVQGPRALDAVQPLVEMDVSTIKYYTGVVTTAAQSRAIVSRTGYTGEDGWELILPAETALGVWESVIESAKQLGGGPAGLGARDTLRLEAAMPLYGHELTEAIHPFQAGLSFAVNLKDRQFLGRDALVSLKNEASYPRRVGLEVSGRRVPRQHFPILQGDNHVGEVTSGTFSPTLQRPIAMGYVASDLAQAGTELSVDVRGTPVAARVVPLPFYKRSPSSRTGERPTH